MDSTILETAKHPRAGRDELPEPTLESVDVSTKMNAVNTVGEMNDIVYSVPTQEAPDDP